MKYTYTLEQLPEIASTILQKSDSKTFLFYGAMGMGKTTLIKELCLQLGVKDTISSPTFSLVNEYDTKDGIAYHFDVYRIEDEEELYQIGFEEYLTRNAWVFIEWPEKIPNSLPDNATTITITSKSIDLRTLTIGTK